MHDPNEGDPPDAYASLKNAVPQTIETLDEGKAIFIRECMVCHGDAGRGQGPYREILQPGPPDFGDGSYGDYTDADYFWRISEGVPWSAMPSWKLRYSEEERWKLVHYLRTFFTQTTARPPEPPEGQDFTYPDFYRESMRFPEDVSFDRGRLLFLQQCAHCHGVAGDGAGWDGQYLDPSPKDFREMAGKPMTPEAQGEHMAKVTFGIQDTAMPSWGEWLPEKQRWDVIKYLMQAFMAGTSPASTYTRDEVATEFALVSSEVYIDEGHTISTSHGAELYGQYCASCHGDSGAGDGPGTVGNASPAPAPFAADMTEPYVFWRIWEGVPESVMYPFGSAISSADIWDMTSYIMGWAGSGGG
jgi:mono/diheme cytochrome c family protein